MLLLAMTPNAANVTSISAIASSYPQNLARKNPLH